MLFRSLERAVLDRTRALQDANGQILAEMAERLQAQEALRQSQRLEAMGQLTGGVAHDFNNLLMVLSAGLDLVGRQENAERRQPVLEGMRQAVERGASLTRQLLTFARRQSLSPQPVDLAARLPALRSMLAASLRGDIEVALDLTPGLWLVEVDPNELELALLNLAVNARDAMPEGGTLTLAPRNQAGQGGDFVALQVADTGTGMDAATLARVFEPFFTTKETGRGSGLGLAQVHGFARSSGGEVRIESTPGAGTRIELLLPRSAATREPRGATGPAARAPAPSPGLRVLIVEDSDAVAALLLGMVEELGHAATRVDSAVSALSALRATDLPDLVLSDVMMPGGLDGMGLVRELRQRHPRLPVVLASGRADLVRQAAAEADVPLLGKPFVMAELAAAIAQARAWSIA